MSRVVCVANQKGGVGKTTTAINLAAGLAWASEPTLLIDLDPQCNATTGLGGEPLARHALSEATTDSNWFVPTSSEGLHLVPGSRNIDDVNALIAEPDKTGTRLAALLENAEERFGWVLMDCPPTLGRLTELALAGSHEILMPIQCEYFAMEGLTQMIQVIKRVMRSPGQTLEFGGILLTMVDASLPLTGEVDAEVREFFGEIVFETVIPGTFQCARHRVLADRC